MTGLQKRRPAYAVSSVDSALRIAAMLQLEGEMTVTEVAERLEVARSTAHRLLAMLVYRDFAVQTENRTYRAGPVLELAAHSQSEASHLRAAALPHLVALVDALGETANLMMRTGDTARFIASVECSQALRVGSREGMVFPAHTTTGGLVLLADLSDDEIQGLYSEERRAGRSAPGPDLDVLTRDLAKIRHRGFALNDGRSERGVVAVGCPVRDRRGRTVAGLSVSLPSVRYRPQQLPAMVGTIQHAVRAIEADLGGQPGPAQSP